MIPDTMAHIFEPFRLIAMMNNTYSLIISQSERAWSFRWARALFALERRLGKHEKDTYLRQYSINVVGPTKSNDSSTEARDEVSNGGTSDQDQVAKKFVPALMIIKRMNWTRAERRRLIVGHWRVGACSVRS